MLNLNLQFEDTKSTNKSQINLIDEQQAKMISQQTSVAQAKPVKEQKTKVRRSRQPRDPKLSVARRNERERNRVKMVNEGFALLRQHLPLEYLQALSSGGSGDSSSPANSPDCSNPKGPKKFSKVETLRAAIKHIRWLEELIGDTSEPTQLTGELLANSFAPQQDQLTMDGSASFQAQPASELTRCSSSTSSLATWYSSPASQQPQHQSQQPPAQPQQLHQMEMARHSSNSSSHSAASPSAQSAIWYASPAASQPNAHFAGASSPLQASGTQLIDVISDQQQQPQVAQQADWYMPACESPESICGQPSQSQSQSQQQQPPQQQQLHYLHNQQQLHHLNHFSHHLNHHHHQQMQPMQSIGGQDHGFYNAANNPVADAWRAGDFYCEAR